MKILYIWKEIIMSNLSVNHLLGIKYLSLKDIQQIFETTDHFKEVINRKIKKVPSFVIFKNSNFFFLKKNKI